MSPDETREELARLLESLRVLLPGIQVLFAFLLTVPYTARFARQDTFQEVALYTTFAFAALSIMFLLAPLAAYRHRYDRVTLAQIRRWNAMLLIGFAFLGLALVGSVVTLTDLIWKEPWTVAIAGAVTALAAGWLWLLARRRPS